MNETNQWYNTVKHRGCVFPCHGHPILKTRPGPVRVAADTMPIYVSCSECGYTPKPDIQPVLVARYLQHWLRKRQKDKAAKMPKMPKMPSRRVGEMFLLDRADAVAGHFCVARVSSIGRTGVECLEFWNEERKPFKWAAFGTVYTGEEAAKAKLGML